MTDTITIPSVTLYTIGHSDHTLEAFLALLQQAGIRTVVDVRSQPYSRWAAQFNRETLARALGKVGLTYVFMGDVLGGRPSDPSLYVTGEAQGRPDYARMAATPAFQAGLEQLIALAQGNAPRKESASQPPVTILCSEGDYHHCHRALLITPALLVRGVHVLHIVPDGRTEEATDETPPEKPQQLSLF
jgi:uncharacterized protein (DUF488 family)